MTACRLDRVSSKLVQVRDPLALHKKHAAEPVRFRDRQYSLDGRRRRRIYDVSTTSISNTIKAYSLSSNFHNDVFIHVRIMSCWKPGYLKSWLSDGGLGSFLMVVPLYSVMFSHTQLCVLSFCVHLLSCPIGFRWGFICLLPMLLEAGWR